MAKQQHRQKHVPQRTCIVCRQKSDKRTLTRIVRTAENGVQIDHSGKLNGRGAYLCDTTSCWETAVKRGQLAKALKIELTGATGEMLLANRPHSEDAAISV